MRGDILKLQVFIFATKQVKHRAGVDWTEFRFAVGDFGVELAMPRKPRVMAEVLLCGEV